MPFVLVMHHVNFAVNRQSCNIAPAKAVSTRPSLFGSFRNVKCDSFTHRYHRKVHTDLFLKWRVVVSNGSGNDSRAFIRELSAISMDFQVFST